MELHSPPQSSLNGFKDEKVIHIEENNMVIHPSCLSLEGDFEQQSKEVISKIQKNDEELHSLAILFEDLQNVMRELWPGCNVLPYGSSASGLSLKWSDVDFYVDIPASLNPPEPTVVVEEASKELEKYPKLFSKVVRVIHYKPPIIRFYHLPTLSNCDVSFSLPAAIRNCYLVAYFIKIEPRFLVLNILLKYFCKVHNLTGDDKLASYGMVLLVMFFFQQGPTPILPSVKSLQKDRNFDIYFEGWNTGFDFTSISSGLTPNKLTNIELLIGFFEFYSTFDFCNFIVCPYLGKPMQSDTLKATFNLKSYENELSTNFSKTWGIQEPFKHIKNVALSVNECHANVILNHFKWVVNVYKDIQMKNLPESELLKVILLQKPPTIAFDK